MKKFLLLITLFLGVGILANAQLKPVTTTTHTGFIHLKEIWVCSSTANPIDLSQEAFDVVLSSNGDWYQLIPGRYTQAKVGGVDQMPDFTNDVLNGGLKLTDKTFNPTLNDAGVYEFLFVNNTANFCEMEIGEQSLVRIYVVPELVSNSQSVQICNGETATVSLEYPISNKIQNFLELVGWNIVVKDKNSTVVVNNEVTVSAAGVSVYTYEIDDSTGDFAGYYQTFMNDALYKCSSTATITLTVNVNDGSIEFHPGDEVRNFCLEHLKNQNSIDNKFKVSLHSILPFFAPGGVWATTEAAATLNAATGEVVIDLTLVNDGDALDFTYTYDSKCGSTAPIDKKTVTVTLKFDAADLASFNDDVSKVFCLNIYSGDITLLDLLSIEIPTTANTWLDDNNQIVENGQVNLGTLNVGVPYNYNLFISNAIVPDFCTLNSYSAKVEVTVLNNDTYTDANTQICFDFWTQAGSTDKINLADVAGLPQAGVDWSFNGTAITGNEILVTDLKPGVNVYDYAVSNDCGVGSGKVYITVTDKVTNWDDKTLKYCFVDQGTDLIDLMSKLGVVGIEGDWSFVSTIGGSDPTGTTFDDTTGKFKAREQYDIDDPGATGDVTYVFEFKVTKTYGCGIDVGDTVEITIVMSNKIV